MKYRLAALAAALIAAAWSVQPAAAQDHTFPKPMHGGQRLDWCMQWSKNCGQAAADAFCRRSRFAGAREFRPERVGPAIPTRLMGSGQVCANQPGCTGFDFITCHGPLAPIRTFANPTWRGHRVDNCLRWGADCGKPAADAFCRAMGFAEAVSFVRDPTPGRGSTRVIHTDQICSGPSCVGFEQIACR